MFIGNTKSAAEDEDVVVIVQWAIAKEFLQGLKTIADLCRIGFMGFCVGLVQLVKDAFAIAVTRIEWVCFYVSH